MGFAQQIDSPGEGDQGDGRRGRWRHQLLALLAVSVLSGVPAVIAQNTDSPGDQFAQVAQTGQPAAAQAGTAGDEPAEAKPLKGRLPNHYGKLRISTQQRMQIYKIQADARAEIAKLEMQIAALRQQESKDVEAVLTDEQRTQLAAFLKEARERRAQRTANKPK